MPPQSVSHETNAVVIRISPTGSNQGTITERGTDTEADTETCTFNTDASKLPAIYNLLFLIVQNMTLKLFNF
ncbi:hypothetical protein scyTo_0002210 [Scyliorhinus torazame]|uniref:Uncharacterized protein n=1 Tax=Scyliorhinus torazame TaxID=75743 RepID=A0A401PIB0_SCYTO|nr:hypothetical protein [Scyliorhinus torazame]